MIYVIYGCDWMIKTIWKFTYKWVLATKHTRTQVLNHSKGFIYVYVLNTLAAEREDFLKHITHQRQLIRLPLDVYAFRLSQISRPSHDLEKAIGFCL
jgi:hypothetical protein